MIPYVNYMELLNTEIEAKARGRVYYEWTQAVDHDALDLVNHPDWICIDKDGKDVPSIWGSNNGHPGLFYTCFHQQGLHDAALAQVRKLMEMGADGVFIDNAGPVAECFGAQFGKHRHPETGSNTKMYQRLQQEVYELVKSFGTDRIVMINSGIIPEQWAWSDAQMWESCICGAGTAERMQEWIELEYEGRIHAEAVRHGKVPVILSYLDARLYGFPWADWFTLSKTDHDKRLAKATYVARLGKPLGPPKQSGKVWYREFEKGLVVLNPESTTIYCVVPVRSTGSFDDAGYDRTFVSSAGKLRLEMLPESGRVMVRTRP